MLYLETEADTGGQVTLTLNDNTTVGTDLSLLGANGIEDFDYAPRATLAPGTTPLTHFATDSETEKLELYTADLEAAFGYTRWGFTVEGTYGKRWAHFDADGEIEIFGVFTSGNFVNLQFSNGSAFDGDGPVMGLSLAYKIPRLPLSIFVGHRKSDLDGASNSFGRAVGSVASSPDPPLIGAATVRRSNETQTDLEIDETRFGLQADFGAPDARVHSFVRLAYEKMEWELDGPPTGGAGFGGTIGDLTTNGFASAGLGGVDLDGWSLAIGLVF